MIINSVIVIVIFKDIYFVSQLKTSPSWSVSSHSTPAIGLKTIRTNWEVIFFVAFLKNIWSICFLKFELSKRPDGAYPCPLFTLDTKEKWKHFRYINSILETNNGLFDYNPNVQSEWKVKIYLMRRWNPPVNSQAKRDS